MDVCKLLPQKMLAYKPHTHRRPLCSAPPARAPSESRISARCPYTSAPTPTAQRVSLAHPPPTPTPNAPTTVDVMYFPEHGHALLLRARTRCHDEQPRAVTDAAGVARSRRRLAPLRERGFESCEAPRASRQAGWCRRRRRPAPRSSTGMISSAKIPLATDCRGASR